MGWYSAVGRPAFLALPPEAAHRVANALLGLPLAWRRMGGVPDDPSLRTSVAGLELRNPIGLAAGFDKTCAHLDSLGRLGFGYVVGGTITRAPRAGNPKPRIVRYPERGSMVNAMGLPNPGADRAAANLARNPRTAPRFVSVADEAVPDAVATVRTLAPHADAIELNASCPNVSWGRDRDNEAHLAELLDAFALTTPLPVLVKLPPFDGEVEREVVLALAGIAAEHGAAGITCANTRPHEEPKLSVGRGGLSGRDLSARHARHGGGRPRGIRPAGPRLRRHVHPRGRARLPRGRRHHRADLHRPDLPRPGPGGGALPGPPGLLGSLRRIDAAGARPRPVCCRADHLRSR